MHRTITLICALFLSSCWTCHAQSRIWEPSPILSPLLDARDTVSVFIVGDVMMHKRQLDYDCQPFLSHLMHRSRAADIAVANLEFSLGGQPWTGYPSFSAPDSYPSYLARYCGFNVFLAANNHVLDRGSSGLARTAGIYARMADSCLVSFTGIASDAKEYERTFPLVIRRKGITLALINFSYGSNNPQKGEWPKLQVMNKSEISAAFTKAKNMGADFIIALPHWGEEYSLHHNGKQQEWAEWLVEQGADAIVGTHPHVVQDSVNVKGVPVYFSIGNAVSNMSAVNTRVGLAITLRFTKNRISGKKMMLPPKADYIWCSLPNMLTDNYTSIFIKEWAGRRNDWLTPYDYDNMLQSCERVRSASGIKD